MKKIEEKYARFPEADRQFDIRFWQSQGDQAIFEAVQSMILDYLIMRGLHADERRLQRTVESFRKA